MSANRKKFTRSPPDGPIDVSRVGDLILICAEHDGVPSSLRLTEWNARRILGALSVILELPLSSKVAREVEM